ncbi:putative outer membrane protein 5 [Chlamydia pecorum]|uniref:Outer membrane protein 5 n=1 Tax=Chlamydia pecorum TaxID=85991 RepID=A0AA40PQL0_9CHLA|nr:putative outer membrane protein 5 [Chlamydia pecorum]
MISLLLMFLILFEVIQIAQLRSSLVGILGKPSEQTWLEMLCLFVLGTTLHFPTVGKCLASLPLNSEALPEAIV